MSAQISRMQFLRGDFTGKETPLRPPWAITEDLFIETCTKCGDCLSQCPTHIIKQARANFPVIDFTSGECLFCEKCVNVCKPQALHKSKTNPPWSIKASVNKDLCLSYQGIECRSCYDPCVDSAIRMPPRIGGISIPVIDINKCSGCGACIQVCPVQAVTIVQQPYGEKQ